MLEEIKDSFAHNLQVSFAVMHSGSTMDIFSCWVSICHNRLSEENAEPFLLSLPFSSLSEILVEDNK